MQDPKSEGVPSRPLDPRALRTLFLELFGRPPYGPEREKWMGEDIRALLTAVLGSEEFWRHWYEEQLWYFLLVANFRPGSERMEEIPVKLAEGRLTVRDALHRVALSSSFDLRNPGADTFVTVVMEQLVGHTVQKNRQELEIGKTAYDGGEGRFLGSTAGSQSDVVRIAVEHKAATRHFIEREYRRYFESEPDSRDLARWTSRFHKRPGDYVELVREWLLSPAFTRRLARPATKTNHLFVRALFVDLMDRLPSPEEQETIRSALDGLSDSRPLRSVIARLLLDSNTARVPGKESIEDPTAWVADTFRRLLGREATPEELAAFVQAFHEPSCRPETVLYALLGHEEYHQY